MAAQRQAGGNAAAIHLPAKFEGALGALWEATQYADLTSGEPWDFAVEIGQFRKLGLSDNDLRLLVQLRYVEHACETTEAGGEKREFRRGGGMLFTKQSCFVLDAAGIAATTARVELGTERISTLLCGIQPQPPETSEAESRRVPFWDTDRGVLYFAGQIVKRFRWRAANQQRILTAFQEEGWPARIDDPLVPTPTLVGKQRLRDTIKCLNRKQAHALVRFQGDGSGLGIRWAAMRMTVGLTAKRRGCALAAG
jgi:hypothetical protein